MLRCTFHFHVSDMLILARTDWYFQHILAYRPYNKSLCTSAVSVIYKAMYFWVEVNETDWDKRSTGLTIGFSSIKAISQFVPWPTVQSSTSRWCFHFDAWIPTRVENVTVAVKWIMEMRKISEHRMSQKSANRENVTQQHQKYSKGGMTKSSSRQKKIGRVEEWKMRRTEEDTCRS